MLPSSMCVMSHVCVCVCVCGSYPTLPSSMLPDAIFSGSSVSAVGVLAD